MSDNKATITVFNGFTPLVRKVIQELHIKYDNEYDLMEQYHTARIIWSEHFVLAKANSVILFQPLTYNQEKGVGV